MLCYNLTEGFELVRYRPTAMSREGVVAAAHPLATLAGAKVLMQGGNAFDAAIATNAVLNVTQPHTCGIGGDAFYLLFNSKKGKVEFINASGRASKNASIAFFQDRKFREIPSRGPLGAITVPGCVDGWFQLLDKYGTLAPSTLLKTAAHLAREGFPISHQLSAAISNASMSFSSDSEWARVYAPSGRAPAPGSILRQTDLARTLELIAEKGRDAFYKGEIAKKTARAMKLHSGLLDEEDYELHTSIWGDPVSIEYRGCRIFETAPNSQAITALIAFFLLSKFDLNGVGGLGTAGYTRLMVEAARIAYKYRDRFITDPDHMKMKAQELLSAERLEKDVIELRSKLESPSLLPFANKSSSTLEDGDTTYFCIADRDHNCVSCIQSLYYGFGSGFIPEGTGVVLHNRGAYFSLDPRNHNSLEPGKRTFHTLCASLTLKNDAPYLLFGTMGGDIQPQVHQQVISSVLDFHTDIQQAIEDPRWIKLGTIYSGDERIHVEERYSPDAVAQLRKLGYAIQMEGELFESAGHAQGITIDAASSVISGGADPRGDGLALGL